MKTFDINPIAAVIAAAALTLPVALPAHAQQGHSMQMPMPMPPASAKPAEKKPAAKKKPPAKPAPAAVDHASMGHGASAPAPSRPASTPPTGQAGMDHSAMGHPKTPAAATRQQTSRTTRPTGMPPAAAPKAEPAPEVGKEGMDDAGMDQSSMQGMDHSSMQGMDQSSMQGMDNSSMQGMDHSSMQGMDHAAMGQGEAATDPDLPSDAPPRTPIPALTAADRAAAVPPDQGHAVHDQAIHSYWLADQLEWQDAPGGGLGWEGLAWIGGDINRAWLRSEGEASDGRIEQGRFEVLYGRSIATWWDVVAGARTDFGEGPSRTYAAFGVQGLAPYKFEVEATAYVGSGGRTAARFEGDYDTLITNRLILQWNAAADLYGKSDPSRGIGSGLSTVEAGLRLRYEITRRFAPYVGVAWERAFGATADLRREDGQPARDTRLVAGIRFWF